MKMPEKYKKYNLIPRTIEKGIDIIIYDDDFLEKLEKKVHKRMNPYKYKHLENYINFLEKIKKVNMEYEKDFDLYIQNLREVNDVNSWSVIQYILPTRKIFEFEDGSKIEPTYIQNKYYFMIYAKHVEESYSIYSIDEQERLGIDYILPVTYFEVIEDPSGKIKEWFNDDSAIEKRKQIYEKMREMNEKKQKDDENDK